MSDCKGDLMAAMAQAISPEDPSVWPTQDAQMATCQYNEAKDIIAVDTRKLEAPSDHSSIWWQLTGNFLQCLVSNAGFTDEQQRASIQFYRKFVISNLGSPPRSDGAPQLWRSFMTDDYTPVEFSWAWGDRDSIPDRRIRFSMEPIGADAGTPMDPRNQDATRALLRQLKRTFRNINLDWFNQLSEHFSAREVGAVVPLTSAQASPSSSFLALELGDSEPLVKTYVIPPAWHEFSAQPVIDALRKFASNVSCGPLTQVLDFLESEGAAMQLTPYMLATDCASSDQSRLKIYARCPDTSFHSVQTIMSIFEDSTQITHGLEELEDLWQRLFWPQTDFSHQEQLPHSQHETSGILYYFEVRPGCNKITVKVYMPVKHYGKDDWSTALALANFFKDRHRIQAQIADRYLEAVKQACTHRSLSSGRGMHTYVSAAIKKDSLDVTSYLNPEVYHPARYASTL